MELQRAIWSSRGPFGAPEHHLELQRTIWSSRARFGAPEGHLELQRTIWSSRGPFGATKTQHTPTLRLSPRSATTLREPEQNTEICVLSPFTNSDAASTFHLLPVPPTAQDTPPPLTTTLRVSPRSATPSVSPKIVQFTKLCHQRYDRRFVLFISVTTDEKMCHQRYDRQNKCFISVATDEQMFKLRKLCN